MGLRFTGTYDGLRDKLAVLNGQGEWLDLNENQKQFRHTDGGILNWYPSTGTINFQGRGDVKVRLQTQVETALLGVSQVGARISMPPKASLETGEDGTRAPTEEIGVHPVPQTAASEGSLPSSPIDNQFLGQEFGDSELVIGLVGAVGTELKQVIDILEERLKVFGYTTEQVRVSQDIIPEIVQPIAEEHEDEFSRISKLMDAGNCARRETGDNSVLALGVAAKIASGRQLDSNAPKYRSRHACIINSLKHPDEVTRLRQIYPEGFYLRTCFEIQFSVFASRLDMREIMAI
jgi:hypothetical protein